MGEILAKKVSYLLLKKAILGETPEGEAVIGWEYVEGSERSFPYDIVNEGWRQIKKTIIEEEV